MLRGRVFMRMLGAWVAILAACGDDASGSDGGPPARADGGRDAGRSTTDGGSDAGDSDAGGSDGGIAPDAGTVGPITFTDVCPDTPPCGGDLVGTWTWDNTCITTMEAERILTGACPSATFESGSGSISGTITFDETTATRRVDSTFTAMGHIPAACTMGFGCLLVGPAIVVMAGVESATCVDGEPDGCDCTITDGDVVDETFEYTITGNTYENDTTMRRWDYCVDEDELTIREVESGDGMDPVEPGLQTLVAE
jgi:hypothetical protein